MNSKVLFFFLTVFGLFFSCNNDDRSIETIDIDGEWNLINISGGFAGVDDDYNSGIIKWTFDNQNFMLVVENYNTQNTIYDGLRSGTYDYSILENNAAFFLLINTIEFGGITVTVNELILNQNEISTGSGADGFILKFER